jgi:hypothetical protein
MGYPAYIKMDGQMYEVMFEDKRIADMINEGVIPEGVNWDKFFRDKRYQNVILRESERIKKMYDFYTDETTIAKTFYDDLERMGKEQDKKDEIKKDIIHAIILIGSVIVITFLLAYVIVY